MRSDCPLVRKSSPPSSSPYWSTPAPSPLLRPQSLSAQWWTAALFIGLSHLVILHLLLGLLFFHRPLPSLSLLLFSVLQAWLQLLGITAGYHRLWSHRAYAASLPLRVFLAVVALQSFQGSAFWWAKRHRLHHRFTDTDEDPHSIRRGFFHAHMGWLFQPPPVFSKLRLIACDDLAADPVVRWQRRYLLLGYVLFGALYPAVVGRLLGCTVWEGSLWVGVVARFLSWHCIWSINSVSHWVGERHFSLASSAVWVWGVELLQNGEGHHSQWTPSPSSLPSIAAERRPLTSLLSPSASPDYHHQFPSDYRHGVEWWHWDPSKWCIGAWALLGLACELRTTPLQSIRRARALTHLAKAAALRVQLPPAPSFLPRMSLTEVRRLCSASVPSSLLLFDGLVLDVAAFDDHPGGQRLLRQWRGRDCTDAVRGGVALHSEAAEGLMRLHAVAALSEDAGEDTAEAAKAEAAELKRAGDD